jgi:hypothetical protein
LGDFWPPLLRNADFRAGEGLEGEPTALLRATFFGGEVGDLPPAPLFRNACFRGVVGVGLEREFRWNRLWSTPGITSTKGA